MGPDQKDGVGFVSLPVDQLQVVFAPTKHGVERVSADNLDIYANPTRRHVNLGNDGLERESMGWRRKGEREAGGGAGQARGGRRGHRGRKTRRDFGLWTAEARR